MLQVTKRKLTILAAAIVGALGLTVVTAGTAFAWQLAFQINGTCDTLTATGFWEDRGERPGGPVDASGQAVDLVDFRIFAGQQLVAEGQLYFPDAHNPEETDKAKKGTGTAKIEPTLTAGTYTIEWDVFFINSGKPHDESGSKPLTVAGCETPPGSAAPGAAAEVDCESDGIKVTLDNTEGSAEADFTVTVGDDEKMQTVAAGETADVSFGPLDDGAYTVVVTEVSTKFEKSLDLTVECVEDETPPPTEPTPTPTVQGSTLPHTGAGFPTGAAAAFALLLVSVGGFLLTYRKGLLPLPFVHRH